MALLDILKEDLFYEHKGQLYVYDEILNEFNSLFGRYIHNGSGGFILLNKSKNLSDLEKRFSIPDDMTILQEVVISSGTFMKVREVVENDVKLPFSDITSENSQYGSFINVLHDREFINNSELFQNYIKSITKNNYNFELQFFQYSGRVTFVHRGSLKGVFLIPNRKVDVASYSKKISFVAK